MVKIFIGERLDMINVKNEDGETPLFFAVRCIIRKFFRNWNNTKLLAQIAFEHFWFVYKPGSESLVKYLISKGADVNANGDEFETTALHRCAEIGEFFHWNLNAKSTHLFYIDIEAFSQKNLIRRRKYCKAVDWKWRECERKTRWWIYASPLCRWIR